MLDIAFYGITLDCTEASAVCVCVCGGGGAVPNTAKDTGVSTADSAINDGPPLLSYQSFALFSREQART